MKFGLARKTLFGVAVYLYTTASIEALAQGIDYSGLEQLFGEPVTAIATGKPQRASDAPLSVEIISHEEIRRSGAMDLPQLLRRAAGVDVSRNFKGQADVNIRGYNQPLSNRLLVLINGRQVYIDTLGFTLWNALPVEMHEIKQIEIVRGPNTSLLGFNAASGVVNIITFNPLTDNIDQVEVRAGTQNHREVSGILTLDLAEGMALRLSGGTVESGGYSRKNFDVDISDKDALQASNANVNWYYRLSENTSLQLEAGFANQEADTMFGAGGSGVFDLENEHLRLAATHDDQLLGLLSGQWYRNQSEFVVSFKKFNSLLSDTSLIKNTLDTLQLSMLKALGSDHNLRVGLEYRMNTVEGASIGTGAGRFNEDILAINAMWEWHIANDLTLTNAYRYDKWETDRDGGIPLVDTRLALTLEDYTRSEDDQSYNSSLVYRVSPQTSLRLSLGKGLHIPSLAELSRAFQPNPVIENYGNPLLETEKNTTLELGINHKFADSDSVLSLSLFRQKLDNIIGQTVLAPGPTNAKADVTFENLGSSETIGLESTLKGRLSNTINWNINYSYAKLDDATDNSATGTILFDSNEPEHKLNLMFAYNKGRWQFDASIHYVHGIRYQAQVINFANPVVSEEVSSYTTANINLAYKLFKNTQLGLHAYNLIDDHQERPSFLLNSAAAGAEELETTFLLTIKYSPES